MDVDNNNNNRHEWEEDTNNYNVPFVGTKIFSPSTPSTTPTNWGLKEVRLNEERRKAGAKRQQHISPISLQKRTFDSSLRSSHISPTHITNNFPLVLRSSLLAPLPRFARNPLLIIVSRGLTIPVRPSRTGLVPRFPAAHPYLNKEQEAPEGLHRDPAPSHRVPCPHRPDTPARHRNERGGEDKGGEYYQEETAQGEHIQGDGTSGHVQTLGLLR